MLNKILYIFLMVLVSSSAFPQGVLSTSSDTLRARQSGLNALDYVFDEGKVIGQI